MKTLNLRYMRLTGLNKLSLRNLKPSLLSAKILLTLASLLASWSDFLETSAIILEND